MIYQRFSDAKEFYNAVFSVLQKHEAQNALPLGNVILGNNGGEPEGWRNPKNWYMSTVSDKEGKILLVSIMTPPFNITLYETDNIPNDEALNCLCENIFRENIKVPGVVSENKLADRFTKIYTEKAGLSYKIHKNLRIYTLEKVNDAIPRNGRIRRAEKKDLFFLPYWQRQFVNECGMRGEDLQDIFTNLHRKIENQEMVFVLEDDGIPVSMAASTRKMVEGCCVSMVYTPPYYRKKGYASSCVAQLSQLLLDTGYEYTSLFTDLANPISNSIYQKIGYRPVCDYNEIAFVSE